MSALDLAVRRVMALMDGVETGIRIVVAGRVAQLDRAGRWMEFDADLLLRWEWRREIGRLFSNSSARCEQSEQSDKRERKQQKEIK